MRVGPALDRLAQLRREGRVALGVSDDEAITGGQRFNDALADA